MTSRRALAHLSSWITNRSFLDHHHNLRAAETLYSQITSQHSFSNIYKNSHPYTSRFSLITRHLSSTSPPSPVTSPAATAISSKANNHHKNQKTTSTWYKSLLLLPPMLAALLGKWQLDRRQWKTELIERRRAKLQEDPIDLASTNPSTNNHQTIPEEYQRVQATGYFLNEQSRFIGPRPRSQMGTTEVGYLVVTPFVCTNTNTRNTKNNQEKVIMVLRGWAPASWREQNQPTTPISVASGKPKEETAKKTPLNSTHIEGVIRYGEDPSMFVPENDPSTNTWYYVDPAQLARSFDLIPESTPLVEIILHGVDETRWVTPGGPPTAMEVLGGRRGVDGVNGVNVGGSSARAVLASHQHFEKHREYPLAKTQGDLLAFNVMPSDHMKYAATWFTLATATTGLAFKVLRKK